MLTSSETRKNTGVPKEPSSTQALSSLSYSKEVNLKHMFTCAAERG